MRSKKRINGFLLLSAPSIPFVIGFFQVDLSAFNATLPLDVSAGKSQIMAALLADFGWLKQCHAQSSPVIFYGRHSLKVLGVDATAIPAQMIQMITIRNWPDSLLIHISVCLNSLPAFRVESGIALRA